MPITLISVGSVHIRNNLPLSCTAIPRANVFPCSATMFPGMLPVKMSKFEKNVQIGTISSTLSLKTKACMYIELLLEKPKSVGVHVSSCAVGGEAAGFTLPFTGWLNGCTVQEIETMTALSGLTKIGGLEKEDTDFKKTGEIGIVIDAIGKKVGNVTQWICNFFSQTPMVLKSSDTELDMKILHLRKGGHPTPIEQPCEVFYRIMDQAGMRLCVQLLHHCTDKFFERWTQASDFGKFVARLIYFVKRFGSDKCNLHSVPELAAVILERLASRSSLVLGWLVDMGFASGLTKTLKTMEKETKENKNLNDYIASLLHAIQNTEKSSSTDSSSSVNNPLRDYLAIMESQGKRKPLENEQKKNKKKSKKKKRKPRPTR